MKGYNFLFKIIQVQHNDKVPKQNKSKVGIENKETTSQNFKKLLVIDTTDLQTQFFQNGNIMNH